MLKEEGAEGIRGCELIRSLDGLHPYLKMLAYVQCFFLPDAYGQKVEHGVPCGAKWANSNGVRERFARRHHPLFGIARVNP